MTLLCQVYQLNIIRIMCLSFYAFDGKVFGLEHSKQMVRFMNPSRIRKLICKNMMVCWKVGEASREVQCLQLAPIFANSREWCCYSERRTGTQCFLTTNWPRWVSCITNLWWSLKRAGNTLWLIMLLGNWRYAVSSSCNKTAPVCHVCWRHYIEALCAWLY